MFNSLQGAEMSEPTAIEKEAGKIVEGACASLEACPCGCNREATAGLFAEMPDEELLFDVADLFKAFSDTTRIKILFALMGGRPIRRRHHRRRRLHPKRREPPAAHVEAGAPCESHPRRQERHLRPLRRPRLHHARPGHDPRVRVTLSPLRFTEPPATIEWEQH